MSSLNIYGKFSSTKNISDQSERSRSDLVVLETVNCMLCMINGIKCSLTLLHLCLEITTISTPDHLKSNLNCIPYLTLTLVLSRPLLSSIKRKLCGAFIESLGMDVTFTGLCSVSAGSHLGEECRGCASPHLRRPVAFE